EPIRSQRFPSRTARARRDTPEPRARSCQPSSRNLRRLIAILMRADGCRRVPLACTGGVASHLQLGGDVPQRALAVVDRIAVQGNAPRAIDDAPENGVLRSSSGAIR